jgi:shikimate dehydrogenase
MGSLRAKPIDGYTRLVGWMGWPAGPWPSPRIYNAAFQSLDLNWRCVPLPVAEGQLRAALSGLRALGFVGAELAEPYQQEAVSYLHHVSAAAETIGAVKLLRMDQGGRLEGDNIRWLGFLATLRTIVPSLNGLRPLILGAGGLARSVAYALIREGLPVTIVNERMDQAIDLVHRLRHVADEHSFSVYRWPEDLGRVAPETNLIVNATGIGMWPDVAGTPWPEDLPFPRDAVVYDLVPWPNQTRFLRQARAQGAWTVSGSALLIYEAALAFEKWTGYPPPFDVMWGVASAGWRDGTSPDLATPGALFEDAVLSTPT